MKTTLFSLLLTILCSSAFAWGDNQPNDGNDGGSCETYEDDCTRPGPGDDLDPQRPDPEDGQGGPFSE